MPERVECTMYVYDSFNPESFLAQKIRLWSDNVHQ